MWGVEKQPGGSQILNHQGDEGHNILHERYSTQVAKLAEIMQTGLTGSRFKEASIALGLTFELLGGSCERLGMTDEQTADHLEASLHKVYDALPKYSQKEVLAIFPFFDTESQAGS